MSRNAEISVLKQKFVSCKEAKISSAKPTVGSNDRGKLKERGISVHLIQYSIRVMDNHAGSTLTRTTGSTLSLVNPPYSCLGGRVVLGTRDHITGDLENCRSVPESFLLGPA